MEGFKKNPKIACFKEGGQVKYESRKEHKEEMAADTAQDKAMVKKGVAQHEAAKHKGETKTELKLKSGGRAKKEKGTVKKYCGGSSVKKMAEGGDVKDLDLKNIKPVEMPRGNAGGLNIPGIGKVKPVEMPKGNADGANIPGFGKVKSVEMPTSSKYKTGGKVKKAEGGAIEEAGKAGLGNIPKPNLIDSAKDAVNRVGKRLYENVMGTDKQNAEAQARLDKYEASKKAAAPSAPVTKKRGGKC